MAFVLVLKFFSLDSKIEVGCNGFKAYILQEYWFVGICDG